MIDLTFENVSKRYIVRQESDADLKAHPWVRKLKALRPRKEAFWALRDVSFEVKRGETLGIIGHNGAGKSTVLKLLSGITTPTSGRITIQGRLSALIEVGSGFHPELTGRENIFLNGAILGMSRGEIASKLDSIVDFAGVRPFLDVPVKRFSSGMYVRLGFSIAAHLDPDILLLDEVLAVGDAAFQEKCLTRIDELKRAGTTIVFISHDLGAVERICDRVILMSRGQVAKTGAARDVIASYQTRADSPTLNVAQSAVADGRAAIDRLTFVADDLSAQVLSRTGDPLLARIDLQAYAPISDAVVEVIIATPTRAAVCQLSTELSEGTLELVPGAHSLVFECPELAVLPGIYYVDVCIRERGAPEAIHWLYQAGVLRVDPGKAVRAGQFFQPHSWALLPCGPAVRAGADAAFTIGDLAIRR